jgi:hypothetical protein
MVKLNFSFSHLEVEIMVAITVRIDLANKVFAVYGVDETGKPVLLLPAQGDAGIVADKRAALPKFAMF